MALVKDLLNSKSLESFNKIKEETNKREEKQRIVREKKELEDRKKYYFKSYSEVIAWLKSGKSVYTGCGHIDPVKNPTNNKIFSWTYQQGDEYDCHFWMDTKYYTEEELTEHFMTLIKKYGNDVYDKFGYLTSPYKSYYDVD